MDEFSNKEVKMTQRELTFIKATQWDKGWRWGLFVGGMIVAVANLGVFIMTKFIQGAIMKELKIALYKMRIAFAKEKSRHIEFDYDMCDRLTYNEFIEKASYWDRVESYWQYKLNELMKE